MGLDGVAAAQNAVMFVQVLMLAAVVYWVEPDHSHVNMNSPDDCITTDSSGSVDSVPIGSYSTHHSSSSHGDKGQQHLQRDASSTCQPHDAHTTHTFHASRASHFAHTSSTSHSHPPASGHSAGASSGAGSPRHSTPSPHTPSHSQPGRHSTQRHSVVGTSGRHWSWSWSAVASTAGVGQYLRVALPSLAMICADWWCFEAMILVAGLQVRIRWAKCPSLTRPIIKTQAPWYLSWTSCVSPTRSPF